MEPRGGADAATKRRLNQQTSDAMAAVKSRALRLGYASLFDHETDRLIGSSADIDFLFSNCFVLH